MPITTVNNSQTISTAKYNEIQAAIASVFTYYGVTPSSVALSASGITITADNQWAPLFADVNRCTIHQTGASIVGASAPTASIVASAAYTNKIIDAVNLAVTDKDNANASQLVTTPSSSIRTTPFGSGTVIRHTVKFEWINANALLGFLRLGGRLEFDLVWGSTSPAIDSDLNQLLANAYIASNTTTYQVSNSNQTPSTYTETIGSHTITVTFTKTNATTYTIDIAILSSALLTPSSGGITGTVNFLNSTDASGGITGPSPAATITTTFEGSASAASPTRSLVVSPTSLSYAFLTGATSASQTITMTNNGNSAITISAINFTLAGSVTRIVSYSWTGGPSFSTTTINAGASRTFTVAYAGTTPGTHNNSITITTNGSPGTITIPVTQVVTGFTLNPASVTSTITTPGSFSQVFAITGSSVSPVLATSYTASLSGSSAFVLNQTALGPTVTFNTGGQANGSYATTLTVSLNGYTTTAAISITLNLATQNLGSWISSTAHDNAVVGMSYDVIGGIRYLTIGVGAYADGAEPVSNGGGSSVNVIDLRYDADPNSTLGLPFYNGYAPNDYSGWSSFLKSPTTGGYGVTVAWNRRLPITNIYIKRSYTITVPTAGSHTHNFSVDDYGYVEISNGSGGFDVINDQRSGNSNWSRVNSGTWTAPTAGTYTLNLYFKNALRQGAVAFQLINDASQTTVWSTLTPVRTAYRYWAEVYRVPLIQGAHTYQSIDHYVKDTAIADGYSYGNFFEGQSMFAVTDDGSGNLSVTFNPASTGTAPSALADQQTVTNIPYLAYYYSAYNRYNNIEPELAGGQTHRFLGFNSLGVVQTSVVASPTGPTESTIVYNDGLLQDQLIVS
jgi:hypothetical protein